MVVLFGAAVYVYFQTLPPQSLPTGSDTDSEDMPESVPVSGISAQPTQDDTISEERLPDSPVTVDVPASTDPPISSDQDSAIPDAPTSVDIIFFADSQFGEPRIRLGEETGLGICWPERNILVKTYRKGRTMYIETFGFGYWPWSLSPEMYKGRNGVRSYASEPRPENCHDGWANQRPYKDVRIENPDMVDEIIILVDGKENRYRLEREERRARHQDPDRDKLYEKKYIYGPPYQFYAALREIEVVNVKMHHFKFPFNSFGYR